MTLPKNLGPKPMPLPKKMSRVSLLAHHVTIITLLVEPNNVPSLNIYFIDLIFKHSATKIKTCTYKLQKQQQTGH